MKSMTEEVSGAEVRTMGILIKYTMSKDVATMVMDRFMEMGYNDENPSYLDCIIFDAALDVLGIEQEYYGYSDEEWENVVNARKEGDKRFTQIKTIDITDTWKEVMTS